MNAVRVRGPLFDGRASATVDDLLEDAQREVAEEGVRIVRQRLAGSLVNPTGFYEAHIDTDRLGQDELVTDSGVVYGPWLEGVSSRNQRTRFKGYHAFRRATQDLQRDAVDITEAVVRRYVGRLG